MIEEYQRLGSGRRVIAFAISVAHSQAIAATFNAAGIQAEHLDVAGTDLDGRKLLIGQSGFACPIWNVQGQIIGWQTRNDSATDNKYINAHLRKRSMPQRKVGESLMQVIPDQSTPLLCDRYPIDPSGCGGGSVEAARQELMGK